MLKTPLQTSEDWNLHIQKVETRGFSQALGQHNYLVRPHFKNNNRHQIQIF